MSKTPIGRRGFLAAGGAVAGALLLDGRPSSALVFSVGPDPVVEPRPGLTAQGSERRLLVAYASAAGSTAEAAAFIGKRLSQRGWLVDVRDVAKAPAPKGYSAVLVGSAVRAGSWLPEATAYVKAHRQELAKSRLAYFTMCMTLKDDTPANRATVAGYIKPVREIAEPRASAFFAGKMDYAKLGFFARQIVKMKKVPEGDYRNWRAIGDWADGLDRELGGQS